MPVAAIAKLVSLPTKTALAILQRRQHDWDLDCARVRIDGHNAVHLFRRANRRTMMVMGVTVPVAEEVEEES